MNRFQKIVLPLHIINVGENGKKTNSALYTPEGFEVSLKNNAPTEFSKTIKKCIEVAVGHSEDFIIISTNNHRFSNSYNKDLLVSNLITAHEYGCDLLCGRIGMFDNAVPINSSLLWIDRYAFCNFVVIYKSFYNTILKHDNISSIDKLSSLTVNKMVVYPFISLYSFESAKKENKEKQKAIAFIKSVFIQNEEKLSIYVDAYNRFK